MNALSLGWHVVFAGFGALLIGQISVAVHIQRRVGGLFGGIGAAYSDRPQKAALIGSTDFVGGLIVGGLVGLLGVSQPENLVNFINENTIVGWGALGFFGPIASARFLIGSATIGRLDPWSADSSAPPDLSDRDPLKALPGIRREAVEAMVRAAWKKVHTDLEGYRGELVDAILERIEDVEIQRCLVRTASEFLTKVGDSSPDVYVTDVLKAIQERNGYGLEQLTYIEALVDALADYQMWEPLEVVYELIERRSEELELDEEPANE